MVPCLTWKKARRTNQSSSEKPTLDPCMTVASPRRESFQRKPNGNNLCRVLQQWNYTRREIMPCSSTVELYTKGIYAVFFNSGTVHEGNLCRVLQQWNCTRRESSMCSTVELYTKGIYAVFFNSGTVHEGNLCRVLQQWN